MDQGTAALLSSRLGRLGVSLVCVGFGLYWGVVLREEAELKRKEDARREKLIQERVKKALES